MINIDATTPQLKAVKDLIDAYCSLDISKIEPFISKNFKFQTFPKTIDIPEEAREVHIERYRGILAAVAKLEIIVHEVIEAPGRVVLHLTGVCSTINGTTLDYDSLSIFSLVDEDGGTRVIEFRDFSDPQKRSTFFAGIAKAAAKGLPTL